MRKILEGPLGNTYGEGMYAKKSETARSTFPALRQAITSARGAEFTKRIPYQRPSVKLPSWGALSVKFKILVKIDRITYNFGNPSISDEEQRPNMVHIVDDRATLMNMAEFSKLFIFWRDNYL